MSTFLIANWYGADERDWAIIGPFEDNEKADIFWHSFFEKDESGWDTHGWESSGAIHGWIEGGSHIYKSPFDFLNKYPRTLDELKDVHARAEFLEGLGFTVPEWVRVLAVQPLEDSPLRRSLAASMNLWAAELLRESAKPSIFFARPNPDS